MATSASFWLLWGIPRYLAFAVNLPVGVFTTAPSVQPPGLGVCPGSGPRTSIVSSFEARPNDGVPHTYRLSSLVCAGPLSLSPLGNVISLASGQSLPVVDLRSVRYFSAHS